LDDSRPDEILQLVRKIYAGNEDELTAKERKVLRDFFGHSVFSNFCTIHHQLGGKPLALLWATEVFRCPNPTCGGDAARKVPQKKRAMKFLAGVLNDPWGGLPMVEPANKKTKGNWNYHVSVQFHICDQCWIIYACNRCD
jgi:hypothetical protein